MGNKSYNHHHLHHHKNASSSPPTPPTSTIFLPLLCRVSIKDTVLNLPKCPKKDDPSSPKVSCMGQVKRRHNNKLLLPFPTPPTATTATAKVKYTKLKKIFSGKSVFLTTTTTSSVSCRGTSKDQMIDRRRTRSKCKSGDHGHHENGAVVVPLNLAELDPPLPVVKKVQQPPCGGVGGEEGVSLWKRRSGGEGLKGLQIQQFQLPNKTSQFSQSITV